MIRPGHWPVEPLAAAVGGRSNLIRIVDGGNVHRAYLDGLTDRQADRWAIRCDLHPFVVWPEMADAALATVSSVCAARDCSTSFVPRSTGQAQRYCTKPCRRRETQRRLRATPEGRARNAEHRRRYYAENAEYERARQARYDRERRAEVAA